MTDDAMSEYRALVEFGEPGSVADYVAALVARVQELEREVADLRPGGRFAWKSKCEELEREVARLKGDGKAVCEVRDGHQPLRRTCGRPAVWRYPAQGGGWMYLCADHGEKHRGSMRGWLEQWTPTGWQREYSKV